MWRDLTILALRNVRRRKARSALTVLGLAVGMTAVVALVSLSLGAQRAIEQQLAKIGSDMILVVPVSGASGPRPYKLDLNMLRALSGVKSVGAVRRETLPVKSPATPGFLNVIGIVADPKNLSGRLFGGLELARGALFAPDKEEVVLGDGAARVLMVDVGESVAIRDRPFRVAGLLKFTGSDQDDHALYLDLQKLEELVAEKGLISVAFVQALPEADLTALTQEIQNALRKILPDREFFIQSSKQLSDLVGSALALVRWTLGAIAGISLLVGGIGLMNTMLMAVLERTREIGILKSVGAKPRHVLALFLIESGSLGLIGGLAGLLMGGALAQSVALLAAQFARTNLLSVAFDATLSIGSLVFAILLGALAGLWPAWRAAGLDPVEALRYE